MLIKNDFENVNEANEYISLIVNFDLSVANKVFEFDYCSLIVDDSSLRQIKDIIENQMQEAIKLAVEILESDIKCKLQSYFSAEKLIESICDYDDISDLVFTEYGGEYALLISDFIEEKRDEALKEIVEKL